MNQIIPQSQYPSALANELFNMSTNVSNLVQNQSKAHQGGKRAIHTSGGPSSAVAAFHSSGFDGS